MAITETLSDENLIELCTSVSVSDIEKELEKRGYKHGWYKETKCAGVIYILVNPAFSSLVKIGYADDVEKRLKTLNRNSGNPDMFHCYATYSVKKRLEDLKLHSLIDSLDSSLRRSSNREFYEMSKEKAYNILQVIAEINGEEEKLILNPLNDEYFGKTEQVNTTSDESTESAPLPKQERLTFKMLNIPIGSELVFVKDNTIKVYTHDEFSGIVYNGTVKSLSAMVRYLLNSANKGNKSGAYQGGLFFTYNGKTLVDIRKEMGV